MPHSPELIERMLKEAGLFDNVKSWFSGFFAPKSSGSKEKKRALSRVDAHFGAKEKDWDRLVDNASRKSFAKAMASDRRADAKLKMHVDNINRLKTGKVLGTVQGTEGSRTARRDGAQSYKIIKLRGSDRLGCTCRDWRFKKSVAQPGEQVDCKHIREFKQMNKTAASDPNIYVTGHSGAGKSTLARKLSAERGLPILELDKTPEFQQFLEMQKQNYRSTGSLGLKKTKKEERAALKAALSNIKRPHIVEGSYFLSNTDLLPSGSEVHLVDRPHEDILAQRVKRTVAKDIARGRKADPDRPRKLGEELIRYYQPGVEHLRSRSGVKTAAYEEDGSFTHDGQKYSLREAFRTARTKPTKQIDVDKLKWVLQYDRPDPKRLANANLNAPVIVAPDRRGRPTVVDGLHRLSKAVQQGKKTLPAKVLTYGEIKKEAAELTARGRNQISEGNFALPGRRYPIHDRSHARNALARVAQHGTPGEKVQVRKAVAAKYPGIEQDKQAGHVEDRIAERAPGSTYEVARIQASIPSMNLRKGQTYHVPLKGGKGYAVIGDIGPKHVVKTVLGPNMRPPGNRAKVARAPRDYKREYEQYHGKPEQVANRSMRNQARRKMGLKNGDPREVDHQTPLSKGGGNGKSNLRAISRRANRTKFTDRS